MKTTTKIIRPLMDRIIKCKIHKQTNKQTNNNNENTFNAKKNNKE